MKILSQRILHALAQFAAAGGFALLVLLLALLQLTEWLPSTAEFRLGAAVVWLTLTFSTWLWIRQQENLRSAVTRELRKLALVALAPATALIVWLAISTCLPTGDLYGPFPFRWGFWLGLGAQAALLLMLGLLYYFCWRRWHCTRFFLGLALAELSVLVWLCWDEAPVEPVSFAAAPASLSPHGTESDAVLRWYCSFDGQPATRTLIPPRLPSRPRPNTTGEWRLFVAAQRDIIRAEWEAAHDARAWIAALDGFATLGDIAGQTRIDRVRPYFAANRWHAVTQLYCAYASLLAVEGRAGEALDVLRPMLSVCRKLQPEACTRARYRCASLAQGNCQNAVQFILQAGPASIPAWRELAAALQPGPVAAVGLRRVLLGDAANASSANLFLFTQPDSDDTWLTFDKYPRYLYLPHATHRLVLEQFSRLATVATEGRGEGLRAHFSAVDQALRKPAFKNSEGRLFAAEAFRSSADFVQNAWRVDDQRRTLLAVVQAKLAEAEKTESILSTVPPTKGPP